MVDVTDERGLRIERLENEIAELCTENARLRVLLAEAAEDLALQGSYADGYSAPRLSLAACVAKYRNAARTPNAALSGCRDDKPSD